MNGNRPGFVSRLDRDGDGKVSRKEFDGPVEAFDRLDANQDGFLTDNEGPLGPPPGERAPPPGAGPEQAPRRAMTPRQGPGNAGTPPFLQRFDRNRDGKVTREEFDGPARRFTTLDRDGNGSVSKDEAAQAGPPGAAPQRPGNRRGPGAGTTGRPTPPPKRPARPEAAPRPEIEEPIDAANAGKDVRANAGWNKLPPSFVFILADDMGWTGLSCPIDDRVPASNSDFYQTPRIDELARQGMRFSNAYSPSSMCTPSRASLLTGKSPARLRMTTPGPAKGQPADRKLIPPQHVDSLPANEITIAEVLRRQDYATAHFGKWHLSGGGPGRHGFDQHDGDTENGGAGLYEDPNPKDVFGITNRAIVFMQQQVVAGKPFYVQLSHYAVHGPSKALDSTKAACAERPSGTRHRNVEYAAMTRDLDTGVGMVLDRIDRLGIAENTYVIFMSDNGAAAPRRSTENQPLSGGKATFWEGGIRVPLIVRGPGVKPNSFCHQNVIGYDLFPTFSELADVPTASHSSVEGTSLVPLLRERTDGDVFRRDREELVFHFPHYAKGPNQTPQSAILAANLKLIRFHETNEIRLFDLARDIGEKNDLTRQMPDKAAALAENLHTYLVQVEAQLPSPNPDYDPATAEQASGQRRGRASGRTQATPRRSR
jgi:arylsulfatase A-like enzyme